MIFALLTEVITFYVRPIAVDVQGFGFEFVSRSTFCLKRHLEEVIHIVLNIPDNVRGQKTGSGASEGPIGASKVLEGPVGASGASGSLGLFDPRGSS